MLNFTTHAEHYQQDFSRPASGGTSITVEEAEREIKQWMELSSGEEDKEEKTEKDGMMQEDDGDEGSDLISFPTPCPQIIYSPDGSHFYFDRNLLPPTFPVTAQSLFDAMRAKAFRDVLASAKRAMASLLVLPMPVHASPTMAFFQAKSGANQQTHVLKPTLINWMDSMRDLEQLRFFIVTGVIPVRPTTPTYWIEQCEARYEAQLKAYETGQLERVQDGFARVAEANGDLAVMKQEFLSFISYCEEAAYFYLHNLEHFIYKAVIEKHEQPELELAHLLTPQREKYSLAQVREAPGRCYGWVVEFFTFLIDDCRLNDEREGVAFVNTINLQAIKEETILVHPNSGAIRVHPNLDMSQLYRGYISLQSLWEYWLFWDTGNVVRDKVARKCPIVL